MTPLIAYLDPATGTLIISAIVGGFAAIVMFIKKYWYKAKSVLTRTDTQAPPVPEALEDEG